MSDIGKFFRENGYYFAKEIYSAEEVEVMESDFDRVVDQLLKSDENVNARWKSRLTDALDGGESVIIHTHNIQSFSAVWMQAFLQEKFLDTTEVSSDRILCFTIPNSSANRRREVPRFRCTKIGSTSPLSKTR